jgi:hypothetical protein
MTAGDHVLDTQKPKGTSDMKLTRTRLVGLAAAMSTMAVAAPVSTAAADTAAVPVATVVGPTFITSAPATFINTNTQVASADNSAGGQFAP